MRGFGHGITKAIAFSVGSIALALASASGVTGTPFSLQIAFVSSNSFQLQFTGQPNTGYVIEYRDSLSSGTWQGLVVLDPVGVVHEVQFTQPLDPATPMRFYRVRDSAPTASAKPTNTTVAGSSALLQAMQQSGPSSLWAESTFDSGVPEAPRVGAHSALSATQAGVLAQTLANEQARTLYACQPFRNPSPARFVDGHWVWSDRRGRGPVDFEADVEFEPDGAKPDVKVLLLDSRALGRW